MYVFPISRDHEPQNYEPQDHLIRGLDVAFDVCTDRTNAETLVLTP
jgi:hypothetical protein